jgi:predicted nucleotidyltransferase
LDSHESLAIELIKLLSDTSDVPINEFGIHGSTSYEMHSPSSDIDIAVYGRLNFLKVKEAVQKLVEKGIVKSFIKIPTDKYRLNRGIYKETDFVFNAIRNVEETRNEYGLYKYDHIKTIKFKCKILKDIESVFRPAIYGIEDIKILNDSIDLESQKIKQVVSMIGEFRGICVKNDKIQGVGMLEKVINQENSEIFYRVVIGSGKGKEFIKPL